MCNICMCNLQGAGMKHSFHLISYFIHFTNFTRIHYIFEFATYSFEVMNNALWQWKREMFS